MGLDDQPSTPELIAEHARLYRERHPEERPCQPSTFNPGDLVRLKSGGPPMTVRHVVESDDHAPQAHCDWFRGADHMRMAFEVAQLQHVERPDPSPLVDDRRSSGGTEDK